MEGLGLNLTWFLFQLGNFVLLFAGLTYLLHKPLLKLLDSRKKEIQEGLELTEEMRKKAAEAAEEQAALMAKARKEASDLLAEVRSQAKTLEDKLETEAAARAEAILKNAEEAILAEKAKMKEELKGELVGLVVQASATILGQESDKDKKGRAVRVLAKLP